MKATAIITIQATALIVMLVTACTLSVSRTSAIAFGSAAIIFIRCSIYIEKNGKKLIREYNRERENRERKRVQKGKQP